MITYIILFAILVALQLGDWISSNLASKIPGAYEANPIMAWLMKRIGFNGALQAGVTVNQPTEKTS